VDVLKIMNKDIDYMTDMTDTRHPSHAPTALSKKSHLRVYQAPMIYALEDTEPEGGATDVPEADNGLLS
jgi:hypothetical protein